MLKYNKTIANISKPNYYKNLTMQQNTWMNITIIQHSHGQMTQSNITLTLDEHHNLTKHMMYITIDQNQSKYN